MSSMLLTLALLSVQQEPVPAVVPDSEARSPAVSVVGHSILDPVATLPATYEAVLPPGPTVAWQDTVSRRPKAIHYSDGYYTRLKIHQIASYLTIPLFAAEYAAGQQLYNKGSDAPSWAKNAHAPLAAGIAGLFAVNTVTGVWNLVESGKDPAGRTRRWIHGVSMIVADAGLVAVAATAPSFEDGGNIEGNASLHRGLAIGSMSLALASYLMMIIWKD
jgi:hypothetical protein